MRVAMLLWMWGCQPALDARPVEPLPGANQQVQTLRLDLHAAQQAWSEGRREEARARVLVAYRDTFEPMERSLRSLDPVATLELEYAFGDLERRMRRNSDALGMAQAVQRITRGTDELVAALPVAPGDADAAPVSSAAAPTAEAAPLPAHLRSGEGG